MAKQNELKTNDNVNIMLSMAMKKARAMSHEYTTIDHIGLSLMESKEIQALCEKINVNHVKIIKELKNYIIENYETVDNSVASYQPEPTKTAIEMLQRTVLHAQATNKDKIELVDILIRIVNENPSEVPATSIFKANGLSKYNLESYLTNNSPVPNLENDGGTPDAEKQEIEIPVLLNERVEKFDNLVGRETEINRVIQTLSRKKKNNVLLVGEPGVGKTAIVEGLVKMIVAGNVPGSMKNMKVYSLDIAGLLAGSRFRGDFEKKLKDALEKVRKNNGVAFIDEIHGVIGAGVGGNGGLDAANILKPLITTGELRVIGATTYEEKRATFDKDKALSRRFQPLDVVQPTPEDTLRILQGLQKGYEDHHKLKFSPESLKAAVDLSGRYMPDRFYPDKAIDIMDETAARISSGILKKENNLVEVSDIEQTTSQMAKVPLGNVKKDEKEKLRNLSGDLKKVVFGQDPAIHSVSRAVINGRAGLGNSERPVGNFLFAGPTGVGKTEVARQLAKSLEVELIRFDMSEYMEKHTVSRLIGAPPGYVGYDQAGLLTDAVTKHKDAVVLLDEIEKAHPDIYNILLQVMDHGSLTDSQGRKADFRNVTLIMTTNAGAEAAQKNSIGFSDLQGASVSNRDEVIKKTFTSEFRNRLDETIHFAPLQPEHIYAIVDKQMNILNNDATAKNITVEVDAETREYLAKNGFDPLMGARPLQKLIKNTLVTDLSSEMLFGKLEHGGKANFIVENGKIKLIATPAPTAELNSGIILEKSKTAEIPSEKAEEKPEDKVAKRKLKI